jgi:hypothetical protein
MKLNPRSFVFAICAAAALACAPAAATVLVFDITSDHCTDGCLDGALGGHVTVTDNGTGTLAFSIQLADGHQLINTGLDATFAFNLTGIAAVTYSGVDLTKYTIPGGNPQPTGNLHVDGTGFFQFGLDGIGNGGSDPLGDTLTFTIAAVGLDFTDLSKNAAGNFFALDILSATTGNTGAVDVENNPRFEGPEPGSLLLLGIGIAALGFARRRMSARA